MKTGGQKEKKWMVGKKIKLFLHLHKQYLLLIKNFSIYNFIKK